MKRISFPLLLLLLFLGLNITASAATAPANVKKLTARASGENAIKLTWSKVSKADGYYIYQVSTKTGTRKKIGQTKGTSFTHTKRTPYTTYNYQVYAYVKDGKKTLTSASASPIASASTKASKPGTPSSFRNTARGNLSATFRWSAASKATGYGIFQYDSSSKSYVQVLSTKSRTGLVKKLKDGVTYKFIIKSYRKVNGHTVWSSPSKVVSVKGKEFSKALSSVRTARYSVKTKRTITVKNKTTKKTQTLKKGTKLVVTSKSSSTCNGYLSNGDQISIPRSALSYTGLDTAAKKDYNAKIKEDYVNSKGYTSPSNWLIWISQYHLKVYVFKGSQFNWKLQKTFPCCIGKWSTRTVTGIKRILRKVPNGQYGGPVIWFSPGLGDANYPEGCAFHNQVDSNMSKAVSNGCVRMRRSDLQYLYDNCPTGTTVLSY